MYGPFYVQRVQNEITQISSCQSVFFSCHTAVFTGPCGTKKNQLIYLYLLLCHAITRLWRDKWTDGRMDGQDYCAFVCLIRFDGGNQHLIRAQHNDGTGASGNISLASA